MYFFNQIFESISSAFPDSIALTITPNNGKTLQQYTYAALNHRANQIARYLLDEGFTKGSLIGIFLNKSIELYASWLALWKIGCVYVPLSPHYAKKEELYYRIDDSGVSVILTSSGLGQCFNNEKKLILLDQDQTIGAIRLKEFTNLNSNVALDDKAYIIYTSGTEGYPKGVPIKHAGIYNCWYSHQHKLNLTNKDTVAQLADIRADVSIMEMMLAFGSGACLYANQLPAEILINELPELFDQYNITTAIMPPTLLKHFVKDKNVGKYFQDHFKTLVNLISATEGIDEKDLIIWRQSDPKNKRRIFNGYGPTETTVGITLFEYEKGRVSIGTRKDAFIEMQFYILTTEGGLSSTGFGEICIAGPGLAEGYWKKGTIDHKKTNDQFVFLKDPENVGKEIRVYKTGDYGEIIDDYLYYLGRIKNDFQVEITGIRVEVLGVIHKLKTHPKVQDAVVTKKNRRLVAYIVLKNESETPTTEELRQCITSRNDSNSAEVPSCFYQIESKQHKEAKAGTLDHNGLSILPVSHEKCKETQHKYEKLVKDVWESLLDYNEIPTDINFYYLGGYSLLLSELLNKIVEKFSIPNIRIQDLPKPLTIESMARFLFLQEKYNRSFLLLNKESENLNFLPKVFFMPPLSGKATSTYKKLSEKLNGNFQYYDFHIPLLLNEEMSSEDYDYYQKLPAITLQEMAYYAVSALRKIQPMGPYYLAGWSFGGLLAFEMALQLQMQQQGVNFLGIIDAQAPRITYNMELQAHASQLVSIIKSVAKDYACENYIEKIGNIVTKEFSVESQITSAFDYILEELKDINQKSLPSEFTFKRMMLAAKQNLLATYHYQTEQKATTVTLYQAEKQDKAIFHECQPHDWAPYIGIVGSGYEKSLINDSTHFTILENPQFINKIDTDLLMKLNIKLWNLPPKNAAFVRREELLIQFKQQSTQKHALLNPIVLTALSGEGGIGKTAIAIDIIHNSYQFYSLKAWFPAQNIAELEAAYFLFSQENSISKRSKPKEYVKDVIKWFENNPGWLIVYDSANNQVELESYLPKSGGNILITSRDPNWTFNKIKVGLLTPDQAELMIRGLLDREDNHAKILARELGYFALAIVQACAYMKQSSINIEKFINLLKLAPVTTLSYLPDDQFHNNLSKITHLSLEAIEKTPGTALLLNICSYLSACDIPRDVLYLSCNGRDECHKKATLNGFISILKNYALITTNPEKDSISMHNLTQIIIRGRLQRQEAQVLADYSAKLIHLDYSRDSGELSEKARSIALIPHLETVYQHCLRLRLHYCHYNMAIFPKLQNSSPSESIINLLRDLANAHFAGLNDDVVSLQYSEKALQIAATVYESDDRRIGVLFNEVGEQFNEKESDIKRKFHEKALEIFVRKYGTKHPDIAVTYHMLGLMELKLSHYEKAIELFQRSVEMKNCCFGIKNEPSITTLTMLGCGYRLTKKYEDALRCFNQAEEIASKPKNYQLLLGVFLNRADLYKEINNMKSSEQDLLNSIELCIHINGEKSFEVAHIYCQLAELAASENKFDLEKEWTEKSDDILSSIRNCELSADHAFKIGKIYRKKGELEKARKKLQQAYELLAAQHRDLYPQIVDIQFEMGLLNKQIALQPNATDLCKIAETTLREMLHGPHHDEVVNILINRDLVSDDEKNFIISTQTAISNSWKPVKPKSKAIRQNQVPLDALTKEQKNVAIMEFNARAVTLFKREKYLEAIAGFKSALEISLEVNGQYNLNTARAYYNIGSSYLKLKEYTQAISNLEECVGVDNEIYLSHDIQYAKHCFKLGLAYFETGQNYYEKSFAMFEKALLLYTCCPGVHEEVSIIKQRLKSLHGKSFDMNTVLSQSTHSVWRKENKKIEIVIIPSSKVLPTIISPANLL